MIILALVFSLLFLSAEILFIKFKCKAEVTRKYVHATTGLLSMFFPITFTNHWYVLLLCSCFFLILIITKKRGYLPAIHSVTRVTRGSILYPVIVYGCFLIFNHYHMFIFYYIPILILAISDPVAEVVGKSFPMGKFTFMGHTKTLSGSFGFFVSTIVISSMLVVFLEDYSTKEILLLSISLATTTTLSEAISHHGFDNLTIPISAIVTLSIVLSTFQ